jgi:hypothetical protein
MLAEMFLHQSVFDHIATWAQIPPELFPSLDEARGSDQLRSPILTELLVPPRQK